VLAAERDAEGSSWWIQRWNGSKYVDAAQSSSMSFSRTGDTMTWTVNRTDIGVETGFGFYVWSSTWDANDNQTGEDNAPDDGSCTYDLTKPATTPTPVVRPVIGAPALTPAKPLAGKRLTVVFPVTRSDTGAALTTGTMIFDLSVAGKTLPHSETFK